MIYKFGKRRGKKQQITLTNFYATDDVIIVISYDFGKKV